MKDDNERVKTRHGKIYIKAVLDNLPKSLTCKHYNFDSGPAQPLPQRPGQYLRG